MRKVLIVGAGFAGRLHAEAWRSLGAEVRFYDPRLGLDSLEKLLEWASVVDFCDTPLSRLLYTMRYMDVLASKDAVFYEKPPVPAGLASLWERIVEKINAVPVHNYSYMPAIAGRVLRDRRVEVVVLRSAPHKKWYPTLLTGGGILADHGYHWLYVAYELADATLAGAEVYVYPRPYDYVAAVRTVDGRLKGFFTWLSPVEDTVLNGEPLRPQPFTEEAQVESLRELFGREGRWGVHQVSSIDVMRALSAAYTLDPRPPEGKEGPGLRELEELLGVIA